MLHEQIGYFTVSSDDLDKKTFYITDPLSGFYLRVQTYRDGTLSPSVLVGVPEAYLWPICRLIQNYSKGDMTEQLRQASGHSKVFETFVKSAYENV